MARTWARCAESRVRASFATYRFDKRLGALCFLAPLIILHSLSFLEEIHYAFLDYMETEHPLIITPAFIFVMCNLLLVAITIMGHPYKTSAPSNWALLPFKPVQVINLTANQYMEDATSILRKSSSHQSLSQLVINAPLKTSTLMRSPSHNTYLDGKPLLPLTNALLPTENLSDEEVNRRFSAFIASRLATMKREIMME